MHLRRVSKGANGQAHTRAPVQAQVLAGENWVSLREVLALAFPSSDPAEIERWASDLIAFLDAPAEIRAEVAKQAREMEPPQTIDNDCVLPFGPKSFRDFMLFERHAVDAARGFVKTFQSHLMPVVAGFETITGRDFPALRPHSLWHRQPVYYFGNHLNFQSDGDSVAVPSYSQALDYELELGFVLAHGLLDASPQEAEAAIGGFVVLNDFSARDVQLDEMRSGFGPQKSKHFTNSMSSVIVTADEILPCWRDLSGLVRINGDVVARPAARDARWSLGEVLAHASRSEHLHPGELFGTGTLPGGSGIEIDRLLKPGDVIEVGIEGIGTITNRIVAPDGGPQ